MSDTESALLEDFPSCSLWPEVPPVIRHSDEPAPQTTWPAAKG